MWDHLLTTFFNSDGPHYTRDCPKKGKLSALMACEEEEEKEETCVGALGLLNSIKGQAKPSKRSLLFTDVVVAGTKMNALVDTGTSHLFISEYVAKRLDLKVGQTSGRLKTVNSEEVPMIGMARDMDFRIGTWQGKENLEVIPLDDYEFVIVMDFLDRFQAMIVPWGNYLWIGDKTSKCMVTLRPKVEKAERYLSTMQVVSGSNGSGTTQDGTSKGGEPRHKIASTGEVVKGMEKEISIDAATKGELLEAKKSSCSSSKAKGREKKRTRIGLVSRRPRGGRGP